MSYAPGPSTHGPVYILGQPPQHCFINMEGQNLEAAKLRTLPAGSMIQPTANNKAIFQVFQKNFQKNFLRCCWLGMLVSVLAMVYILFR